MPSAPENAVPGDPHASARGWNGIQLAVLGFIGLCGVLQGEQQVPFAIEMLAGVLAVLALVLACLAVVLVGLVAWPLRPVGDSRRQVRLIRSGIVLTFLATALIATSALSGWWPDHGASTSTALVQVHDLAGRSWCGQLTEPASGTVTVATGSREISIPLDTIAQISPVQSC